MSGAPSPGAAEAAAPLSGLPWWLRRVAGVAIDAALVALVLFLIARLPALWFKSLGTLGAVVVYIGVVLYYVICWGRGGQTLGERLTGLHFTPESEAPGWGIAIWRGLFQALLVTSLGWTAAWSRWTHYDPWMVALGQVLLLGIVPMGQIIFPLVRADRNGLIDLFTESRILAPDEPPAPPENRRREWLAWGVWVLALLGVAALPLARYTEGDRALMAELMRSRGILAVRLVSTPLPEAEAEELGEGDELCITFWVDPVQMALLERSGAAARHWTARARAHHEHAVRRVNVTVHSGPFVDLSFPSRTWQDTLTRAKSG